MSQILIDRELLQQILDEFLDMDAEVRAYFGIQQKMHLYYRNPSAIAKYAAAVEDSKKEELAGTEGLHTGLREMVQTEADAAFLAKLLPRLSHHQQRSASKRQTTIPPQE